MMKKVIVLSALVLFIFSFSFKLFADWDDSNKHRYALNLEGYYVEDMSSSYSSNQRLVPEGSLLTVGDIEQITYTYELMAKPDYDVEAGFKSLVLKTAKGEVEDVHNLFNIETEIIERTSSNESYDELVVKAVITLSAPENSEESNFIKQLNSFQFDVTLNAKE